jgi:hypothetical protein
VTKNLRPGTIVILHDGIPDPRRTIEALEPILAAGDAKGLHFVSVGTLLENGEAPPNKLMQRKRRAQGMEPRR